MATWVAIARDAYKAAFVLHPRHPRSCVSRAYFAAYAVITAELDKAPSITFGYGGNNPAHGRIQDYVQHGLSQVGYSQNQMNGLKQALRLLRRDRERADYMPGITVDEDNADKSLRRLERVFSIVGVRP